MTAVQLTADDDLAVLTIDDGKANALSFEILDAIDRALDAAESAKALVLAGRPGRFCAGFDLGVMNADLATAQALVRRGGEIAVRLYMYPRPVVAACTGHALAAGGILLMACDHRVGAAGAFKIGLNEVNIGLPLPAYLCAFAKDRLSRRHLTAATLLAQVFDPESARDVGFIDEVVDADAVVPTASERARSLGAHVNARALAASREPMRGATARFISEGFDSDLAGFFIDR